MIHSTGQVARIGVLLEDQPHKERAPERSSIAELAGKKAGLNALPMNIAREAKDQWRRFRERQIPATKWKQNMDQDRGLNGSQPVAGRDFTSESARVNQL